MKGSNFHLRAFF